MPRSDNFRNKLALVRQIQRLRSTRASAALGSSLIHRGMFGRRGRRSLLLSPSSSPLGSDTRHPLLCAIKAATCMAIHPPPQPPPSHAQCTLQCEAPAVVLLLCKTYQSGISDHVLMWNLFLVCQRKERKRKNKGIGFKYD